jgi:pimeloyl-ACP methyl ester carboxylesterase
MFRAPTIKDFSRVYQAPFKAFPARRSHHPLDQKWMTPMPHRPFLRDTHDTNRRTGNIRAIPQLHRLPSSAHSSSVATDRPEVAMQMKQTPRTASVIALHCSGAGAGQWRQLGDMLGAGYTLLAPEHYGCDSTGPWTGGHAFTLADEAARTVELIDRTAGPIHLVGHSYGGGVALNVAVRRPHRIASLTLYEPSAFHLLKTIGPAGADAFAEILAITARTGHGVLTGDYAGAAAAFIDFWSGMGTWASLRPPVQAALTRWILKAPLDFRALIDEPTPASAYGDFDFPVLVMRGEHAPAPTRLIAEMLPDLVPEARLTVVAGAGHMGPLTHCQTVTAAIARHIMETDVRSSRGRAPVAGRRATCLEAHAVRVVS